MKQIVFRAFVMDFEKFFTTTLTTDNGPTATDNLQQATGYLQQTTDHGLMTLLTTANEQPATSYGRQARGVQRYG